MSGLRDGKERYAIPYDLSQAAKSLVLIRLHYVSPFAQLFVVAAVKCCVSTEYL